MMQGLRPPSVMALCAGMALQACASVPQPAVPAAFFVAPSQGSAAVQALIREQERQVQTCAAARSCPRAHYLRGLAALYDDRTVATKHFQAALAAAPDGPYAASSRYWLELLRDGGNESPRDTTLARATERLVREVLEDEAAIRQTAARLPESRPADAQAIQSLKRQLKERESKIDELTHQIDALKRVDQEVKDRVKPSRPAN